MAKIIGHGAPTKNTFGVLGQEYFDKDSNKVYTCTKVIHKTAYRAGEADGEYEWSEIGGGGGASSWNDLTDKPFEKSIKLTPLPDGECVGFETVKCANHELYYYYAEGVWLYDYNYEPSTLTIEFDGQLYEVNGENIYPGYVYGDGEMASMGYYDWDDGVEVKEEWLPFATLCRDNGTYIITKESGIHTLKAYTAYTKVKTLDAEFLPEGYPKVEYTKETLIDNVSFEGTANGQPASLDIALVENASYKVIFNGTEYYCDSFTSANTSNIIFIGNVGMVDGVDDGIPFCIGHTIGGTTSMIKVVESGTHTITIEGLTKEITPMDEKFIPKEVAKKSDIEDMVDLIAPRVNIISKISPESLMAYGNGVYIAVKYDYYTSGTANPNYKYSTDGVNWTEATFPVSRYWCDAAFGNGVFVVAGKDSSKNSTVLYSYDGITWNTATYATASNGAFPKSISGLIFKYNKFYLTSNTNASSADGVTWYKDASSDWVFGDHDSRTIYGNGVYILSSSYSGVRYSTDGNTWSDLELPPSNNQYEPSTVFGFGDGKFTAVSYEYSVVYHSDDGINWNLGVFNEDAEDRKKFDKMVESDGMINYSNTSAIYYVNGMFVMVHADFNCILYSADGIEWNVISSRALSNFKFDNIRPTLVETEDDILILRNVYDPNSDAAEYVLATLTIGNPYNIARESDVDKKYATKDYVNEKFMSLLTSPNGTKYKLSVADDGTLSAVAVD